MSTVHDFPKEAAAKKLICEDCGASVEAACDCGAAYLPAGKIAAAAVRLHPEKSNRMIAEEIGIDESTVRRVRSTAVSAAVGGLISAERVGLDGKLRRLPQRTELPPDLHQQRLHASFEANARKAIRLASYNGQANEEIVHICRDVARAWEELARKLEKVEA